MTDSLLTAPPGDGVSSMTFSPNSSDDFLLISSWDSTLRLYDIKLNIPLATHYFEGGLLTCCFNEDGSQGFAGGLDNSVQSIDLNKSSDAKKVIYNDEMPISTLAFNKNYKSLLSGSWSGNMVIWDNRQNIKAHSLNLPGKIYSLATSDNKIVVATSGRNIAIYDIRNISEPAQIRESPLKCQTRKVSCSPDGLSFTISSVEGRLGVEYFDTSAEYLSKKYAFKCHRKGDIAYPVNTIEYHPVYGTFATGGCDGIVNIWDGDNKKRLCLLGPYPTSISALAFSNDGKTLAIASSYTYEQGEKDSVPEDNIYLHSISDSEVKPKSKI